MTEADILTLRRMRQWLPLTVIVIVTIAASINRQLIGLIIQPVKVEFGLSDTQIGTLFSVIGVVVAISSPFLGQVVDRMDRYWILASAVFVWSIATAAFGLSYSFAGLGISFAILATAETTLIPVCNSLIAGQFKGSSRINANLVYFAAGGLTTGVGAYVGGLLLNWAGAAVQEMPAAKGWEDWRLALMATAAIGLPLVFVVLTLGRDKRKPTARSVTDITDLISYLRDHWRTLLAFNIANAGYFIAATAVMTWIPIYLVRKFEISPADLGIRLGVVIGFADVCGIVIGLLTIKKLYQFIGPLAPRYIFQISLCLIAGASIMQLLATTPQQILILLGVQNFLATFGTACFNNMAQDISAPEFRGKIFGINSLFVSAVSIPAPLMVGALSDLFIEVPQGLLLATMIVAIPAILLSAVLYGLTNQSFLRTVETMRNLQ